MRDRRYAVGPDLERARRIDVARNAGGMTMIMTITMMMIGGIRMAPTDTTTTADMILDVIGRIMTTTGMIATAEGSDTQMIMTDVTSVRKHAAGHLFKT